MDQAASGIMTAATVDRRAERAGKRPTGASSHSGSAPSWLVPASMAFLTLPNIIFVLGWTRPLIAVPSALAGAAVLWMAASATRAPARGTPPFGPRATTTIWSMASALGVLTGAGGFAPQTWDWLKHNAILHDLVAKPWPVMYDVDGDSFGLTYYIGYYLPAATVGKLAGWQAANAALLIWTVFGIGLALTWFTVLVGRSPRQMVVMFVGFSGLDIVGRVVLGPLLWMPDPVLPSQQLDWWAVIGKYPSHVTSVMWGPQHALNAWVAAGLLLYIAQRQLLRWVMVPLALAVVVSPLVAVGLVPLALYALLRTGEGSFWVRARQTISGPAWLALILTLPILVYLGSVTASLPEPYANTITHGFALSSPIRPLGLVRSSGAYALLIVLEVMVFVTLLRRTKLLRTSTDSRRLLFIVTTALVVLPLYRYGAWSDLAMRAVVPSMFALAVVAGRAITSMPRHAILRLTLILCLVVGLAAPLGELTRAVTDTHAKGAVVESHFDQGDIESTSGLATIRDAEYSDLPRFWAQYVADGEAFFFRHIARRLR